MSGLSDSGFDLENGFELLDTRLEYAYSTVISGISRFRSPLVISSCMK